MQIKYCGDFVEGNFEGCGILYYDYNDKTYYEGEFKNNKRYGNGKYYLKNILKYEGEFKDDEYDGEGTIYYQDGSDYKGGFSKGKKNGEGIIYDKNNSILDEGEFENGIAPINFQTLTCRNCGCSTNEHHLLKDSVWECHLCNKKCKNNCLLSLFDNAC